MRLTTILAVLFVFMGCTDISKRSKPKNPYEEYSLWKDTDKVEEPEPLGKYIPESEEVTLKTLVDAFSSGRADEYAMNRKYSGQVLKVTGRTSGVNENGELRLQIAPFHDVILCKEIPDHDFLTSVKKDDIVEVTGLFNRIKVYGGHKSEFSTCYEAKIIR